MAAEAVVFLRPSGGDGFGHVGWGFNLPSGQWVVGAMENPSGWPFELPGWTGFWYREVPQAAAAMRNPVAADAPKGTLPYEQAKMVDVIAPRPAVAQAKLQDWASRPFSALGGNCMNCAYDILEAFGAALPDPSTNPQSWAPNNWFAAIAGAAVPA